MNRFERTLQSIKKHHKETLLMLLITLTIFSYQEYGSDVRDRITNSHIDAASRADYDNDHGGNAQVIVHQDGTYGVGFGRSAQVNITLRDCASWVVTRVNGTVQQSPPC
jgi:hypothetical protein